MKQTHQESVAAAFDRGPRYIQMSSQKPETNNDPTVSMPMQITLDQIRPYDKNPRTTRNPMYEDLKMSIRERGLDSPPQITRRPGDEHYIVCNGGNTRVEIMNELWKETHEPRFFQFSCLFVPYISESSILAGHLIENEMRGHLSCIEKSVGINNLKTMFEEEDGKPLTLAALSDRLKKTGLIVSKTQLSRMLGCIEYLLPALARVLYQGLGVRSITNLLALRNAMFRVYKSHVKSDNLTDAEKNFDQTWFAVLNRFDTDLPEFCEDLIREQLLGQLAVETGEDFFRLEFDLKKELGEPIVRVPTSSLPMPDVPMPPDLPENTTFPSQLPKALLPAPASCDTQPGDVVATVKDEPERKSLASSPDNESIPSNLEVISPSDQPAPQDKPSANLAALARRFSDWAGKPDFVRVADDDSRFIFTDIDSQNSRECTVLFLLGGTVRALVGGDLTHSDLSLLPPHVKCERLPDALFNDFLEILRITYQLNH